MIYRVHIYKKNHRKIRNLGINIRHIREKKVIEKYNLRKFRNECELLKIRRCDYTNYLLPKNSSSRDFIGINCAYFEKK